MKKKIINWLRGSLEDGGGKSSSRKLTAFWFVVLSTIDLFSMILFGYLVSFQEITIDKDRLGRVYENMEYLFIFCNGMILILFGILTVQNIIYLVGLIKGGKLKNEKDSNINN